MKARHLWYTCQCWAEEKIQCVALANYIPFSAAWGLVCHNNMIPKPGRAHMCLLAFQHLISMHTGWLWWQRGRLWLWPHWELSVTRGHHCWWLLPAWEKPLGFHPNLRLNNTEPITTSACTAAQPLTGRLGGKKSAEIWCKDWWHSVFCGDKGRLVPFITA